MKKKIDRNYKTDFWPKSITLNLNWLPFLDVMEFTAYKIDNDINIFPSLLKKITMFKIKFWWNKKKR